MIIPLLPRLIAAIVFVGSAALFFPVWAASEQSELKGVQQEMKHLKRAINTNQKKKGKEQKRLEKIEQDIIERTRRQALTKEKYQKLTEELSGLRTEYAQLSDHSKALQMELAETMKRTYRMGRQEKMQLLLSAEDPAKLSRASMYYRYFAEARAEQIQALSSSLQRVSELDRELVEKQSRVSRLDAALQADQVYLAQLKKNREKSIAKLNRRLGSQTDQVNALKAREKRLKDVIAKLERQRAAKKKSARKTSAKRRVGQGTLPLPAQAKIVAYFGDKRPESGLPWDGIRLEGEHGQPVRTIDQGEVIFAEWLKGYGNMVLVDHGDDLLSLYAYNKELMVAVGDQVGRNQAIARMGQVTGESEASLFFQIRHKGKVVDPLKWCKT